MSQWPAMKARRVVAALLRLGWVVKREASSHQVLARDGWADTVFAFHDSENREWPRVSALEGSPFAPLRLLNLRVATSGRRSTSLRRST